MFFKVNGKSLQQRKGLMHSYQDNFHTFVSSCVIIYFFKILKNLFTKLHTLSLFYNKNMYKYKTIKL